jgi:hypothetical protein
MDLSTQRISPLRQRMIDDMRMRKLERKTQEGYIGAACKLAAFLRRSPDTATVEDLRRFQLHLVDQGISPITLNATLTGLKFFFDLTLDRHELMAKMQPVRVPRTLPVVLSREEVARLVAAAPNLKSQTALSVDPLSTRQLKRAIHAAAAAAHIDKRVSMHTLRYPLTYCYTFRRAFYSQGITRCMGSVVGSWRPCRTALTCAWTTDSDRSSRRMIHGADETTCAAGRVRSRISRRTTVWLTPSSFEACSMVTQSPFLSQRSSP